MPAYPRITIGRRDGGLRVGTDARTKRNICLLGAAGFVSVAAQMWAPKFDGLRALTDAPSFTRLGIFALVGFPMLRLAGLVRIPAVLGRIALWLCVPVLIGAAIEWAVFTPQFQGRGTSEGIRTAQVMGVWDGDLRLAFADGTEIDAGAARGGQYGVQPGQCLTVESLRGRFGVSWIDFYPIEPRPEGHQPGWAHCFGARSI